MAPRIAVRRDRDNVDYSAVGKQGRRTGVTLEQRPLDANGMEEITGIFSSPRKPSPLKQVIIMESVEKTSMLSELAAMAGMSSSGLTPNQGLSSRRSTRSASIRRPRSSSPRKSGISGAARKSNGVDIFLTRKSLQPADLEDRENTPIITPTRNVQPRRFSPRPENSLLRDITTNGIQTIINSKPNEDENEQQPGKVAVSVEDDDLDPYQEVVKEAAAATHVEEDFVPVGGDDTEPEPVDDEDDAEVEVNERPKFSGVVTPDQQDDDEEVDQTFEPEPSPPPVPQNQANSRKKRKSDALDHEIEASASPVPVKIRKTNSKKPQEIKTSRNIAPATQEMSAKAKGKQPLKDKDTNMKLSARQEKELDEIIEKVKERPGPTRSLYILRRETPADESVTHTRSGRVSVKPLAYWRNERCVYGGGSPSTASLQEGARFPLNSIKEIVRTEEIIESNTKKKSRTKKTTKQTNERSRKTPVDEYESSASEPDDTPEDDPFAEPWETENGTFRGNVSRWDQAEQTHTEQEDEIEIAHAAGAIITKEVKGSSLHEGPTFRYTKLLSTKFFGTGIVELPPGGMKRPKNSRKMYMAFFVLKGRVTVNVGPVDGAERGNTSRFSIGKGGFWQVPRGNQYSIENELEKSARIFFSQACETEPTDEDNT